MPAVSDSHASFHARFLCHLPELHTRAIRLARVRSDADDLVQQTLERALRCSSGLGSHTNPRAWLLRTLFNLFVDTRRQRTRLRPLSGRIEGSLVAPAEYEPAPWEMIGEPDLWRSVDRLPGHQREVLRLSAREGRTYRGIGLALGVPAATVGTRLLRARKRVRQILESPTGLQPPPQPRGRRKIHPALAVGI
jgi:RNA polymerase sigma-70 factor, ECF subfamily